MKHAINATIVMKIRLFLILVLLHHASFGQTDSLKINDYEFIVRTKVLPNEWETKDTVNELYRVENGSEVYVLNYFSFKDQGGDCNNLFWCKETIEVEGNRLLLVTQYFQKTGIDPIPTWRKQIYEVNHEGNVSRVYDKYRYYDNTDWVDKW